MYRAAVNASVRPKGQKTKVREEKRRDESHQRGIRQNITTKWKSASEAKPKANIGRERERESERERERERERENQVSEYRYKVLLSIP